jgi:hypothetical protein
MRRPSAICSALGLLSILAGHKRYAHVTSIRSDAVNPELLGMNKVVSEDALRRGLDRAIARSKRPEKLDECRGSVDLGAFS